MNRPLNPAGIRAPFGRYSHGVAVPAGARLVFCSGQLGVKVGDMVSRAVEGQAEVCFQNIAAILAEAGMGFGDVVRINAYVTNREDMKSYMTVREPLRLRSASRLDADDRRRLHARGIPGRGRGDRGEGRLTMRQWIKTPLAILAEGAEGGIVVEDGRITALVAAGAKPEGNIDETFDASCHVVIPGLINTHHHFFQTLTRAHPAAINKELFPWLKALYPIWAKNVKPEAFRQATRLALTELLLSGCTCASDHQYLYPAGLESAMDIQPRKPPASACA